MSYSKYYTCKFVQANSWHHELFHFHLSFWIWKRKNYKHLNISRMKIAFYMKKNIHSFWRAITWWKNKNLIKVADTSFKLKLQQCRVAIFCLPNPCWWLWLWQSSLNVPLVWFLNLLGVKVLNLNLGPIWQAAIRDSHFFVVKKVDDRTAVDTFTFDQMLFQFCVTTATSINFTQSSNLNKSVWEILP